MSDCASGITGEAVALLDKQRSLENHMLSEGMRRFRRRLKDAEQSGEASTFGAGIKLLAETIGPVQAGLDALLADTGKRGPKHHAYKWVQLIGSETAAYITARCVINAIGSSTQIPVGRVANDIVGLMLDELRFRRFAEKRPALFEYKMAKLPGTNYRHNKKVLEQSIRWAIDNPRDNDEALDLSDLDVGDMARLTIGMKLIDVLIATTGLVTVEHFEKRVPTASVRSFRGLSVLRATPETLAWLAKRNGVLEGLTPVNLPMVVPPLPWGPQQKGGYRFALRGKWDFVRHGSIGPHREVAIPLVYAAVNAVQDTPWTINRPVLQLVEEIRKRGKACAGLPAFEKIPAPRKPKDIETNAPARKRWRAQARLVHEQNAARVIRQTEMIKTLLAVEAVKDEAVIYFPCSVDFRGRVYPIPNYLNPQGDDLSKALLRFADAKPLGDEGAYWLAVHGANCLDETPDGLKVKTLTLDERVQWIQKNTKRICEVATDPFADLWWAEADEPLQFFAFCVEWRGFYLAHAEGRGTEYECGLPVAQDGSCNGLQHFSALFRDPIGGTAVNLTPNERPHDVYQAVAEEVLRLTHADASGSDPALAEMARRWLASGLVKRKLCKRPTMTFGYGSKLFGFRAQTEELLNGEFPDETRAHFTDEDGQPIAKQAALYIAKHIWTALGATVVKAQEGMKWMQDCARRIATETNQPVRWIVPVTNFYVQQDYYVSTRKRVATVLAGQIVRPSVWVASKDVLLHRQVNAVAPNIIHSLDAACLMLTVVRARQEGVTTFGMIHDSYATVPADCGTLARVTREAFVEFYTQHDVVGALARDFAHQLCDSEKPLPDQPAPGSLNVSDVLRSEYFFS